MLLSLFKIELVMPVTPYVLNWLFSVYSMSRMVTISEAHAKYISLKYPDPMEVRGLLACCY